MQVHLNNFLKALCGLVFAVLFQKTIHAQDAYIAKGHWIKLKVTQNAVLKLTYSDLKNAGFDLASLDPRKITLIGNQGGMMSEINIAGRKPGMLPIPIIVNGETDGSFDNGDEVIFYLRGPHQLTMIGDAYLSVKNLYENASYYYLGVLDTFAPRIKNFAWSPVAATYSTNRRDFVVLNDTDLINPQAMGRKWFGEQMGNETLKRSYKLNLPANTDESITATYRIAGYCEFQPGSVTGSIAGSPYVHSFSAVDPTTNAYLLDSRTLSISAPADKTVDFGFEFYRQNTGSKAWVDYMQLTGTQPITLNKGYAVIRNRMAAVNQVVEYQTSVPASGAMAWNVTDPFAIENLNAENGSGNNLKFTYPQNNNEKIFVVFNPSELAKPELLGTVPNMNLCSGENPDLLIITHESFKEAALRLADYRRTHQNYKVKVVTLKDIYTQYNGGGQDIVAIREYLKDEYLRGNTLKYVLLMGTTSYDFKDRVKNNTNFIPIYQRDSDTKIDAFCMDDFFGFLKEGQGNPAKSLNNELVVTVGRIPCRTLGEANGVVDKLMRYDSKNSLGPWRQELAFVSDDRDQYDEYKFTNDCETSSVYLQSNQKAYNVQKYYLDAFKQITSGNAQKYPDAARLISETVQGEALFMTYVGHGGESGWAQERVLTLENIKNWKNPYAMPVLFTATCEFGRYDNPAEQSGGELALLNPNGGAIAMLTTTRLVYVNSNSVINGNFWQGNGFEGLNNRYATIGEYYKALKNRPFSTYTSEDPKFSILGDPSMPLAIAKNQIVLDSVNGKDYTTFSDTLKAFGLIKIKGHVSDLSNQVLNDFSGNLWVKIFDKLTDKYSLNNDKEGVMKFSDYSGLIFKGITSVNNGYFTITFVVPKDISYKVGIGKISLYAHNGLTDAAGFGEVKVGSSESDIHWDTDGPVVKLFLNDTFFRNGQVVQPNSLLVAGIYDKDGINTTGSGIGRDILAVLDANTPNQKEFVLNSYFIYDLNSYQKGSLKYELFNLSPGKHTLSLIAFDIFNNPGKAEITFVVKEKEEMIIYSHKAYPNPFSDKVTLQFEHSFGNQEVTAAYTISDATGRVMVSETVDLPQSGNRENRLVWDASKSPDGSGSFIKSPNNSMYFYRVVVTSKSGASASFSGKLIKTH